MPNYQLQQEVVEELGDSDRQSNLSGISQQDRDNKTILLRQAASGKDIYNGGQSKPPFYQFMM